MVAARLLIRNQDLRWEWVRLTGLQGPTHAGQWTHLAGLLGNTLRVGGLLPHPLLSRPLCCHISDDGHQQQQHDRRHYARSDYVDEKVCTNTSCGNYWLDRRSLWTQMIALRAATAEQRQYLSTLKRKQHILRGSDEHKAREKSLTRTWRKAQFDSPETGVNIPRLLSDCIYTQRLYIRMGFPVYFLYDDIWTVPWAPDFFLFHVCPHMKHLNSFSICRPNRFAVSFS